jgi:hypothetical protein
MYVHQNVRSPPLKPLPAFQHCYTFSLPIYKPKLMLVVKHTFLSQLLDFKTEGLGYMFFGTFQIHAASWV